ncbi:MAG: hypothetical protein ACK4VV_16400, partial [Pseudomonas sp.]
THCLALLLFTLILSGCAAPARVDQMAIRPDLPANHQQSPLYGNLVVGQIMGGKDTNPMWVSQVSNEDFRASLQRSLSNAGLLASNADSSQYELTANLDNLRQPFVGASITVSAKIHYILTHKRTGEKHFEQTIDLPYTAAFNAALIGTERLRIANEGAIRTNIAELIRRLHALELTNLTL